MPPTVIAALIIAVLLCAVVIPIVNARQFRRLPQEQKVRLLMKQAKGLTYFKNISDGSSGTLVYIKNKRKIYTYPWVLKDGRLLCTRRDLYDKWDYPEEQPPFSEEEKAQAEEALREYNRKTAVKLYVNHESDE